MTKAHLVATEGQPSLSFVLGRVHSKIGGPTRTILGYYAGLQDIGATARIVGLGNAESMDANFPKASSVYSDVSIAGGRLSSILALLKFYSGSSEPIVIVGVWHLPFFVLGTRKLLERLLLPGRRGRQVVLVPTMSLCPYDWAKHRLVKLIAKPAVSFILSAIDEVVFASTGEQTTSLPRTWKRSRVVLHPTSTQVVSDQEPTERTGLVFVGRIDRQKDLPLLLRALAKLEASVHLTLVGDGDESYKSTINELIVRLGLEGRVRFRGWLSHDQTQNVIRSARVCVVTSVIENFCHAAAEALVGECELVLVERVLSAPDFSKLAEIQVVPANVLEVASAIEERLEAWHAGTERRARTAIRVAEACSPASAARQLLEATQNL